MTTYHNKLVRDGIIDKILRGGETADWRPLSADEFLPRLVEKLAEESEELEKAQEPKDVLSECADVLEVWRELERRCVIYPDASVHTPELYDADSSHLRRRIFVRATGIAGSERARYAELLTGFYWALISLARAEGLSFAQIESARQEKRLRVGGFEKKILLISTG
ncbi:MAG TPA: nucleoside triphosphate pyrophosphohydrolase [Candidatus Paceibacterota bacterium]|nr:nucleoside triphosphate pyrophosphohydrolase [Candidatus Paceibacterota bacterium]